MQHWAYLIQKIARRRQRRYRWRHQNFILIGLHALSRENHVWGIWWPWQIKIIGQRLEEAENFKNIGTIISNEGSKPEILSRLEIIWRDKNISLASKVKLMRTLILSTFLYTCESWTLTTKIQRRIQALEMWCYRDFWTFPTKTMWRTRRFATESRMQLECMIIS